MDPLIHGVFGHFQNLNLLALLGDLRAGQTVRNAWSSGAMLCPIAHGLPHGEDVKTVSIIGQSIQAAHFTQPGQDCDYAARHLGAEPDAVFRFVRVWDQMTGAPNWLLRQLEMLWEERLEDAHVVQEMLQESAVDREIYWDDSVFDAPSFTY
jgi:hypothetical protein